MYDAIVNTIYKFHMVRRRFALEERMKIISKSGETFFSGSKTLPHKYVLLFMALPSFFFLLLFYYVPIWGWSIAFVDYIPGVKISESTFVGLKYFNRLFDGGSDFLMVVRNTLVLSGLRILLSPVPIALAIMISEVKSKVYKRSIQTLMSLPNFISWIVVYSLFFSMLSVNEGLINVLLVDKLGILERGIDFLAKPEFSWPMMTFAALWKESGWVAIIYLAAITGIDKEQYQAAQIDGANKMQQIKYITIPGILPTFAVMFVLSVGNIFNSGFDQYFVFHNAMVHSQIEVIDTYVYRIGLQNANFSFATAVGVFKTFISITLLLLANTVNKKIMGNGLL